MLERLLVLGIHPRDVSHEEVASPLVFIRERLGVDEAVLRVADLGPDSFGAPPLGIEALRLQDALHEPERLVCVEDAERAVPAEAVGVAPQETSA